MQNQKAPNSLPFILVFLFTDLIFLGITICFENYASFEGFMTTVIGSVWIILLGIAFLALILSIILIKNYLALRNAIIQSLMGLVFAVWFGIARIPMINDGGANHYLLFALGSFLLLAVNICIQIDLLLAPSIKGFLTMDKKDRLTAGTEAVQTQSAPRLVKEQPQKEEQPQIERRTAKPAASIPNQQTVEKPAVQKSAEKKAPTSQKSKPVSNPHTTQRFSLEDLTDEQRKQFQEYQAKRRAARLAAQQQTRRIAAAQEQERPTMAPSSAQPAAQKNETAAVRKMPKHDDGESLFF